MAEANASAATPLSSVFPTGSGVNAAPVKDSSEPEKTDEKPDKVPASSESESESSPKKA